LEETDERALTCTTKNVPARELPHACKKLNKTTSEESHANDNVRGFYSASLDIDKGEDECRRREGEETPTHGINIGVSHRIRGII
jgi:hypothetical protein